MEENERSKFYWPICEQRHDYELYVYDYVHAHESVDIIMSMIVNIKFERNNS